jgi:hypothetical protein
MYARVMTSGPTIPVASGWAALRYGDVAGLGAILCIAISESCSAPPAVQLAALLVGAASGALLTWIMKQREH